MQAKMVDISHLKVFDKSLPFAIKKAALRQL
jgi:hypothetical protein